VADGVMVNSTFLHSVFEVAGCRGGAVAMREQRTIGFC